MRVGRYQTLRCVWRKSDLWIKIALLASAGLFPALVSHPVSAAQLTSRKVTINKGAINATDVEHIFAYTIPNTSATKGGIIYDFCTTPLGTCTVPTNMTVETATHDGQSGWPNNGNAFALYSGSDVGDCVISSNVYRVCYQRDETVSTGVTGGAVTHTISNITAPNAPMSAYVRVSIYSDNDFGTVDKLDEGVVAAAFTRQLTVSGRVQERLEFCVAAIDDVTAIPSNCASFPSTTNIELGVIDNNSVVRSPVDVTATNLANDFYGVAMTNTNASSGVVVAYYPEAATNVSASDTDQLYAFRVLPTDCSATTTSTADQCFISAAAGGEAVTAGTERFGMHIPCIDAGDMTRSTTTNLGSVPDAYNNADNSTTSGADCENSDAGNEFAWNVTGAAVTLASSTTVVDDEAIKLRFGATASPTTPNGLYTVVTTYIATATF